jgi:hypothetical protein
MLNSATVVSQNDGYSAALGRRGRAGDRLVQLRASRMLTWVPAWVPTWAAMAAAIAVGGCADVDVGPGAGWFSKPIDVVGKSGGFSVEQNTGNFRQRPITPNDLVDANGACPAAAAPAPPPPPPPTPDGAGGAPPIVPEQSPLLGGGIGLGMSECDVVQRAGAPNSVNLGSTPARDRTAVLTYSSGPRPGIYRFTAGRLTDIERGAEPEPPPAPAPAKKKKPAKPKTANNA